MIKYHFDESLFVWSKILMQTNKVWTMFEDHMTYVNVVAMLGIYLSVSS